MAQVPFLFYNINGKAARLCIDFTTQTQGENG